MKRRITNEAFRRTPTINARDALRKRRVRSEVPDAHEEVPEAKVVSLSDWGDETLMVELLRKAPPYCQSFREGDYIHVSDIIHKCARRIALIRRHGVRVPTEAIPDGQALTFAQGDAIHDYIKHRFVKGHPDKVWATWSCSCGSAVKEKVVYAKIDGLVCDVCGTSVNRHHEVPFTDDEYMVSGSPDLLLWLPDVKAYYITEIKSIAGEAWKELARPVPDHVIQVAFYWWLMNRRGLPLVDKVSILYANKEYSFKSPYKEFTIDMPDALSRLDPYLEDLAALVEAKNGGALPMRVVCPTMDSSTAKKCSVCVACFHE